MADVAQLGIEVNSRDVQRATERLDDLSNSARQSETATESLSRRMSKLGQTARQVGAGLTIGVSAPLAAMGALSLRTAGNFEAAMNKVRAVSGATADSIAELEAQAKELGATTQFSASQAADAMSFLAMAGFNADEIMGALPNTLQLASAAQMDLATAADITSNVLTGYNKKVSELAQVNDVLVKTFVSANTDLQQLGEAMKFVGPVASAAGVSFEETAAAIALLGNAGIQGGMAGTSLRGAISRLLSPSKEASKVMKEMGVNVTDANGRLVSLDELIEQLAPHADDAGKFMQIFGQRAGPAMAALVAQGADALRELTGELENSAGTAAGISSVQMEGFNGAMRELASAFEAAQIAVAQSGLIEFAGDVARRVADFLRWVAALNPELLKWGTIIAGVVAAIGPLLIGLGVLLSVLAPIKVAVAAIAAALGLLTSPITLTIAAVAGLVAAWVAWGDQVPEIVDRTIGWISDTFNAFVDQLGNIFSGLGDMMVAAFVNPLGTVKEMTDTVTQGIADSWQWLSDTLVGNSIIPDMNEMIEKEFERHHTARLENLRAWLEAEQITNAEFRELELEALTAYDEARIERQQAVEAQRLSIVQQSQAKEKQLRQGTLNHAVGLLQVLGRESKAAAVLGIAITKGMEIARTIQTTASAAMLAYASQLVPGDPTSLGRAEAARAATVALGATQVALIAATGFAQGRGAMGGGGRGGGGGGGGAQGDSFQSPVAPAASAQDVTIRLDSDRNVFTRRDIEQILEGLNDALADGAQIRMSR